MSRHGIDFTYNTEVTLEVRIRVDCFTPGYPAPACSNPSSPAFSDPGDDPEYESAQVVVVQKYSVYENGERVEKERELEISPELQDLILEMCDEGVIEAGIQKIEKENQDYLVEKYEESRRE